MISHLKFQGDFKPSEGGEDFETEQHLPERKWLHLQSTSEQMAKYIQVIYCSENLHKHGMGVD